MENFFPSVSIVTYFKNSKIKHSKRVNFSRGIVHTAAACDVKQMMTSKTREQWKHSEH